MLTPFSHRFAGILLAGCAFGAMMIACGKNVAPTAVEPVQPTLSSIQAQVFNRSCALPSCHSSVSQRGGLILEAEKSYANLVNVRCVNDTARSQNKRRVVPFKPDSSFLFIKITGPGSGEGSLMPDGAGKLPQQMIDAIRQWIEQGAQNN